MLILKDLPTGVIVGSAVIEEVTRQYFGWHLGGIARAKKLRKPKGHPQPVWFADAMTSSGVLRSEPGWK